MLAVNTYSIFLSNGKFCGYINDRMNENELEIGVELREKHRNQGIFPQAFALLMNYLYKVRAESRVVLQIFKSNSHSRHVAEKMGAVYDGEVSTFGQQDLDKIEKKFEGVIEGSELWDVKKKAIDEIMWLIENGSKICKYHFDLPLKTKKERDL